VASHEPFPATNVPWRPARRIDGVLPARSWCDRCAVGTRAAPAGRNHLSSTVLHQWSRSVDGRTVTRYLTKSSSIATRSGSTRRSSKTRRQARGHIVKASKLRPRRADGARVFPHGKPRSSVTLVKQLRGASARPHRRHTVGLTRRPLENPARERRTSASSFPQGSAPSDSATARSDGHSPPSTRVRHDLFQGRLKRRPGLLRGGVGASHSRRRQKRR